MNIKKFLNKVNHNTESMTHQELQLLIYEIAKSWQEERREYFLHIMNKVKYLSDDTYNEFINKNINEKEIKLLLEDIDNINVKLNEINNGQYALESDYNEEWDDWYNSSVDEYVFMDYHEILEHIDEAINLVHSCIDLEVYKDGYELAIKLSTLKVAVEGEYCYDSGSEYMPLPELIEHDLLKSDYKKFATECIYLTYMSNELEDKAEKIYMMLDELNVYNIRLEDIYNIGNCDLPNFDEFLKKWIELLNTKKGHYIEKLLVEAHEMLEDDTTLIENARKYSGEHPELYEQLIVKMIGDDDEKLYDIYQEAINAIPVNYNIRSNIALHVAKYACKIKDYDYAEKCWIEAFRSNANLINYLRIICNTTQLKQSREELRTIYHDVYKISQNNSPRYADNIKLNIIDREEYYAIMFFDECFDMVYKLAMSNKNALGWTGTFMKEGIALFLLLLLESDELDIGGDAMLQMVVDKCLFRSREYIKGTAYKEQDEYELFWQLFTKWKSNVKLNEKQKWLDRMEKLIEQRVQGIMDTNRRNYYEECAAYIAAIGEVKQSFGNMDAKNIIMHKYKTEYSRRRAFHQELSKYGMSE